MICNEPIKMKWAVKCCDIQNKDIVEIKGLPQKEYNPFDYYNNDHKEVLYRKFISIDENNDNEILEFIRTYGFLGLNSYHRKDSYKEAAKRADERVELTKKYYEEYIKARDHELIKWFAQKIDDIIKSPRIPISEKQETFWSKVAKNPELIWITKKDTEINAPTKSNFHEPPSVSVKDNFIKLAMEPMKESLNDIRMEIQRMKLILTLWDSISFEDTDSIDKNTTALFTFGADEASKKILIGYQPSTKSYDSVLYFAKFILSGKINEQISHVRPYLSFESPLGFYTTSKAFEGNWDAPDLLSAMYIMIYMDFIQGKMIRKCRNETCPEWFEIYGNDNRKIYCSAKCANTQGKRESRRRIKKEKGGV